MLHSAAGPNFQNPFSECSLTSDPHPLSSKSSWMAGGGATFKDQACWHVLDKIHFSFGSLECEMWDMQIPSTNKVDCSSQTKLENPAGSSGAEKGASWERATFEHINDLGAAESSTMNFDSQDPFELCESLESPRASGDEERRAWQEQRRYKAWMGARNLHVQ
jgi:hypothetical protein